MAGKPRNRVSISGMAREFLFHEKSTMVLEFVWLLIQRTPETLSQEVK
jgi:hypothetical protein